MDAMGVVVSKNKYEKDTAEYQIFEEGVQAERDRLLSVLNKYHRTFCKDGSELSDHLACDKTMQIRYLYEFVAETKTVK
jgi:hypothetical protein